MSETVSDNGKGLIKLLEPTTDESEIAESKIITDFRPVHTFVVKERTINSRIYEQVIAGAVIVEKFFSVDGRISRYVCIFVNTEVQFVSVVYSWSEDASVTPTKLITSNVDLQMTLL